MDRGIVFADRADAGRRLTPAVRSLGLSADTLVCGITRGGVVVAAEVARELGLPLRAVVARKVGAPGHGEFAIGAVGPDGSAVLDDELCRRVNADERWLEDAVAKVRVEVARRVAALPRVVDADAVRGRTVLVVDDGVATGSTALAVGRWLASTGATRTVLALPCGPPETVERLSEEYDDVVALSTPSDFMAVGQWYRSFPQTSDREIEALLT